MRTLEDEHLIASLKSALQSAKQTIRRRDNRIAELTDREAALKKELQLARQTRSKYKTKYLNAAGLRREDRLDVKIIKALESDLDINLRALSEELGANYGYVRRIAAKYKKALAG